MLPAGSAPACTDCSGQSHYDHIHTVDRLPLACYTDERIVRRGYVVEFAGQVGIGLPASWVFFADLEPAVDFGRSPRMSGLDISYYAVCEAARENRWSERANTDVVTLYVKRGSHLRDHSTELPLLNRWVQACRPDSDFFEAPPG